jgi:hypothetical protein
MAVKRENRELKSASGLPSRQQYRVALRYLGDEVRTHGWCAGIPIPRETIYRTVSGEQLQALQAHKQVVIEHCEEVQA